MGFLDSLFDKEKKVERTLAKHRKKLTNMYVQPADRQWVIADLREMASPESVEILLERFQQTSHNTTIDADEKQLVYDTLVDMGQSGRLDVVAIVTDFLHKKQENVNWPLKVLADLVSYEQMHTLIVELLAGCNTDYARNPEKKQELILQAASFKVVEVSDEVARFLDDQNETIRFLAVDTLLQLGFDDRIEAPLRQRLIDEDSMRICQKLAQAFLERPSWIIPEDQREEVGELLPEGYLVHRKGHIYKRRA